MGMWPTAVHVAPTVTDKETSREYIAARWSEIVKGDDVKRLSEISTLRFTSL